MQISLDEPLIALSPESHEVQELDPQSIRITNRNTGGGVAVSRGALGLLEFFEEGATLSDLIESSDLNEDRARELINPLLANYIIAQERDHTWLRWGVTHPSVHDVGTRSRFGDMQQMDETPDFVIFGVPLDLGGELGPRHGPDEVRRRLIVPDATGGGMLDFDSRRMLTGFPRVVDIGNVSYMGGESMETVGHRISLIMRDSWRRRITPIMLGGDHSWTHFPLRELIAAGEDFGIIHFGAQADVYPMRHGLLTHGNVLLPSLRSPSLKYVLQLGLRGMITSYGSLGFKGDDRVEYMSARRLATRSPESVFAGVPRDLPCYLTFDATSLDARETGGPVIGGISHYTGLGLFEYLRQHIRIIGADFVEVIGCPNRRNRAAESTARYIFELMSEGATTNAIPSHVSRIDVGD